MKNDETIATMINAIQQRQTLDESFEAYRLFNGFYEGYPGLVLDRYGPTLVVFNHNAPGQSQEIIDQITRWGLDNLQGVDSAVLKQRQHPDQRFKNGILIAGRSTPTFITEFSVRYALDLQMNQDASFYLDTRNLRRWLLEHMSGLRVLNTFAYTGSLGVAAGAAGATKVVQTDLNQKFLDIAQKSWKLNALAPQKCEIIRGDFFRVIGQMRRQEILFDCVILDPPFFSTTEAGKIDLEEETSRLINKVRPLVAHEGWLVVINNALYLPGADLMEDLQTLSKSEYFAFKKIIPIPVDVTGYPNTIVAPPPTDPTPFNHPTKIATCRIYRKDGRK